MFTDQQAVEMSSRMARIESRLVQLMYHMGIDPAVDKLLKPRPTHLVWRKREGTENEQH